MAIHDEIRSAWRHADSLSPGQERLNPRFSLAGRIMGRRKLGQITFFDLKGQSGSIQLQARSQDLSDYRNLKDIHHGDIIEVEGYCLKTAVGEPTLRIGRWALLTSCEEALTDSYYGIKDVALKRSQRELDIIFDESAQKRFERRSEIIYSIRDFLAQQNFMEVETPILQPLYGGANADPFVTTYNALKEERYLRIAPELYLKRCLVAGYEKVFEIGKNFRNEGISALHNPEFTSLEFYEAYSDYELAANLTWKLIQSLGQRFKADIPKEYVFSKVLEEASGIDIWAYQNQRVLAKKLEQQGLQGAPSTTWIDMVDWLFDKTVQPHLKDPSLIFDYPIEMSPLAQAHEDAPLLAERWELYIQGMEVANGYNELTDAQEQAKRLKLSSNIIDQAFIRSLEIGLPPCAGVGVGVDRLVMLLTYTDNIKDVILFP